jgi:predicted ABC-type ATPase
MSSPALDLSAEYLGQVQDLYVAVRELRKEATLDDALGISRESQRELKLLLLDIQKARRHPRALAVHERSRALFLQAEVDWARMLTGLSDALVARFDIDGAFHAAALGWITPPDDAEPADGVFVSGTVRKDAVAPPRSPRGLSKPRAGDEAAIRAWGGDRAALGLETLLAAEQGADVRILRDSTGKPVAVAALARDGTNLKVALLVAAPGGGNGTRMMQLLAKIARREGRSMSLLSADSARGFYQKLGMKGDRGLFSFTPAQAAAFAQAGGYIAPPGAKKPKGMSTTENLALQTVAQNILQGGLSDVRGRLASGVNFDSWHEGAMQRYIGMTVDTSTLAGQVSLEHLGYHHTFEWAHPQQMARDMFAVRGSKVVQQMYGDHVDTLTKIITDATDPRNPRTLDQVRASIREQWPDLQRYQVDRIARTETAAVWTTTAMNTYAANGISQFESIVATGPSIGIESEDPCDECIDAAADVHSVDDTDLPPWHANCRCEAIPVLEGEGGEEWLPPDEPWTGGDEPVTDAPMSEPDNITPAPYPGEAFGGYGATPAQEQAATNFAANALPALKANDGFSVAHTGDPYPTKRYVSATAGNEQIIKGPLTHEDLRRYYLKHLNDVTGDGAALPGKMFYGGWRDANTGWTYLDTSTSFADREAAMQFGRDHIQEAIYDSKTGESIYLGVRGAPPEVPKTGEPWQGTMYHGTASENIPSIMAEGFRPATGTRDVWLTSTHAQAQFYQDLHAEEVKGFEGAVLGATVQLRNPFVIPLTKTDEERAAYLDLLRSHGITQDEAFDSNVFREKGFDGLVYQSPDYFNVQAFPEAKISKIEPAVEPFRMPGSSDAVPFSEASQQADGRLAALGLNPDTYDTIKRLGLDGWPPKKGKLAEQMFPGKDVEDTMQLYKVGTVDGAGGVGHWVVRPGEFHENGLPKRDWVGGQWTEARKLEHQKWEKAVFEGKVKATGTPQAMFTAGGGASGKGASEFFFDGKWRSLKELEARNDVVVIDPDGIKKMADEFKALQANGDIYAASSVHEESSELSKLFMKRALSEGYNVIFDTTASGEEKFIAKLAEAKNAGYEVQVTKSYITTKDAVGRSIDRAEKVGGPSQGRYVNIRALIDAHEGASRTTPLWQRSDLVDRWRVYDNTARVPALIAEGGGGVTTAVHDTQVFDTMLEKGGLDRSPTPFTPDTFQGWLDSQPVGTRFTIPQSTATGAVHGTWEQQDLSGMRFWHAVDGRQAGEYQSSGYFGTTYQRPVLDALGPPSDTAASVAMESIPTEPFKGGVAPEGTILYHGTKPGNIEGIRHEGIRPSFNPNDPSLPESVYLTNNRELAALWGGEVVPVNVSGLKVIVDKTANFDTGFGNFRVKGAIPAERIATPVAPGLVPSDAAARIEMPAKTDRFREEFRQIGMSQAGEGFSQHLVQTFADWPYLNPRTARELRTWLKTEYKDEGLFGTKALRERGVDDPKGMRKEVQRVLDSIDKKLPEGKQNPVFGEEHPEAASAAYVTGGYINSPGGMLSEMERLGVQENELAQIGTESVSVGVDTYKATNKAMWVYHYQGTAVVIETPMSKDALSYSWEQAKEYQAKINAMIDKLPDDIRGRDNLGSVFVGQGKSPSNERLSREYGIPGFESAAQASGPEGKMWVWDGSSRLDRQDIFDHEFGHVIGYNNGALKTEPWQYARAEDVAASAKWASLVGTEGHQVTLGNFGITTYGGTKDIEDWAESVRLYLKDRREGSLGVLGYRTKEGSQDYWVSGRTPTEADYGAAVQTVRFADVWPNRAALLDKWLFGSGPADEADIARLRAEMTNLQGQLTYSIGGGDLARADVLKVKIKKIQNELFKAGGGADAAAVSVAREPAPYMAAAKTGAIIDVPETAATETTWGEWKKLDDGRWQAVGPGAATTGTKRASDFLDVSFAVGMTLALPGPALGYGVMADRAAWLVFMHELQAFIPPHPLGTPTAQEENKKTGATPYEQTVQKLRRKAGL